MEKKHNNGLLVLLCVLSAVLLIFGTVVGMFIYSLSTSDDAVLTEETTVQRHECEYDLEFFNDPSLFVNHIEKVTGYDLTPSGGIEGEISITLSAVDKDFSYLDLTNEELDPDTIYKYLCYISLEKFSEEYIQYIEEQITNDKNFIESLGDLKILTDSVGGDNIYEYKMVYVMDTEEFNTMPDTAGEYHIITVYYDMDSHGFSIGEFKNKYWKLEKSAQ